MPRGSFLLKMGAQRADALDAMGSATLLVHARGGPDGAWHEPDGTIEPAVRFEDFERVEDYIRAYLDDGRFGSTYPEAYQQWSDAWAMLWYANSRDKVIAVGAKARAAMAEFAHDLIERDEPPGESADSAPGESADSAQGESADSAEMPARGADSAATLDRGQDSTETLGLLAAAIETYRPQLGDGRCMLQEEMLGYWRSLNEAVERHEHAVRGARQRLRWEDGRRLVIFTALLMVEIDRCIVCLAA